MNRHQKHLKSKYINKNMLRDDGNDGNDYKNNHITIK